MPPAFSFLANSFTQQNRTKTYVAQNTTVVIKPMINAFLRLVISAYLVSHTKLCLSVSTFSISDKKTPIKAEKERKKTMG